MKENRRQANYELLRILAMLMVVTMHYLYRTGALLAVGESADAHRIVGTLLESFCIVAVNVYVLISGYFLVEAGYRTKRILTLVCQVLFYAVLIPLIMVGAGMEATGSGGPTGVYCLAQYLLPIETEHYWFATSYVLLYLFTPVLNIAVKNMSRKQLKITLGGLLVLFCLIKSVSPMQFVTDRFGYDFGWFLCVYLVAAYLRLYGGRFFSTAGKAWGAYLACVLGIFTLVCGAFFIHGKTGAFAYYFTVPFHYNFLLCLVGAVALFKAFGFMTIREGRLSRWIRGLAPYTFGVYLFHEHVDIRGEWTLWMDELLGPATGRGLGGFLLHLLLSVLIVYTVGVLIDAIRSVIFSFVGRHLEKTRLSGWVRKLDEAFIKGA